MAVDTINSFLLTESGRFAQDILQKTLAVSPFMSLMEEGPFPEGMGYSVNITTYGRSLPSASYAGGTVLNPAYSASYWTDVSSSNLANGSENNCTPPTTVVQQGNSKVLFNLQHTGLESERFCATDLLHVFDGPRQLAAIKKNLSQITQWMLTEKYRKDFTAWCDNKVVVNNTGNPVSSTTAGLSSGGSTALEYATFNIAGNVVKTGALANGGVLTQGLLQEWYYKLCLNGAGQNALVKENMAPVFQLVCGMETSRRLKVEANYRDDFRWSSRADELLQSIGLTVPPILGFQHVIDITPPRWNISAAGGTWSKVEPYIITAGGNQGYIVTENPAYHTATHEDSFIFHKDVIKMCYPGSVGNTQGTGFAPLNYRGTWGWRSIPSEDKNPDGQVGYFRGVFMMGAMPEYTNYGVVIRHARCGATPLYAACA